MEDNTSQDEKNKVLEMHAIIRGYVQGVFFRATTRQYAQSLGITGTVRNVPDGTVEIFAQGTREQLDRLMEMLLADSGPGHVDEVNKSFALPVREFSGFGVVY